MTFPLVELPGDLVASSGHVTSADGTPIGYLRIGAGPTVVVCHGSFAAAQDWVPFAVELAATHTVILYDRRGRGMSPSAPRDSAVDAEVDDLAAVMDLAGSGAAMLGHSFGGGCVLAYAARSRFDGPVVVYEPRHAIDGPVSGGHIPEIRRILAEEGSEAALRMVLDTVIALPAADIESLASSPLWARMRKTVAAFPDEVRLLDALTWSAGDLDSITGPTWLIVGEQTRVLDADREGALRSILPSVRKVTLPDQGHFAYASAPGDLADAVRDCVSEGVR